MGVGEGVEFGFDVALVAAADGEADLGVALLEGEFVFAEFHAAFGEVHAVGGELAAEGVVEKALELEETGWGVFVAGVEEEAVGDGLDAGQASLVEGDGFAFEEVEIVPGADGEAGFFGKPGGVARFGGEALDIGFGDANAEVFFGELFAFDKGIRFGPVRELGELGFGELVEGGFGGQVGSWKFEVGSGGRVGGWVEGNREI